MGLDILMLMVYAGTMNEREAEKRLVERWMNTTGSSQYVPEDLPMLCQVVGVLFKDYLERRDGNSNE